MGINDKYIKSYFKGNKRIINPNLSKCYYHKTGKKFNQEIYDYVINRYKDSNSFKESLYRIFYNIEVKPKCKYCGKPLEYKDTGYKIFTEYCSFKCQMKYLNKIGKLNNKESVLKGKVSREKTMLKRYGVDNPYRSKEIRQKIKETFIKHYGVDNPWKAKEIKDNLNYKLRTTHAIETKRKNNSFNTSKEEEKAYNILKERFNTVKRQYKDKRYPYCCDFYIPENDLFIECNFHWTHGKHPFNSDSIEDISLLEEWKFKNTRYYNNAIKTWTIRDVEKRNIAKKNNLNYIEIFNTNELYLICK